MRKSIIIGNWKMNGSICDIKSFISEIKMQTNSNVDFGLCVPNTLISSLKTECAEAGLSNFKIGAQNMHAEENGAYTGELSAEMIKEVGANTVIVGHSERRMYYNETDKACNKKLKKALKSGLLPILCVGESLELRKSGKAKDLCKTQLLIALEGFNKEDVKNIVIAYEPIWAIGTGKTASSKDAEEMLAYIRSLIAENFGESVSEEIRLQYGGSVKPANIKELMAMPNIDGALVGGASLKASDFVKLVNY